MMLALADKLHCITCGVTTEAKCSCGTSVAYIPAGQAAALAIAAHPDWSDRRLAEAVGVGVMTIARARPTVPNGTVENALETSPELPLESPKEATPSSEPSEPITAPVPPVPPVPQNYKTKNETGKRIGKDGMARNLPKPKAAPKPPKEPTTVIDIIRDNFTDGKWHPLEEIAAKANVTAEVMFAKLDRQARPSYVSQTGAKIERKKVGTSFHYRMFKLKKMISLDELIEKLTPIIEKLEQQGKTNLATMVPYTVAQQATALKKLLKEWAE